MGNRFYTLAHTRTSCRATSQSGASEQCAAATSSGRHQGPLPAARHKAGAVHSATRAAGLHAAATCATKCPFPGCCCCCPASASAGEWAPCQQLSCRCAQPPAAVAAAAAARGRRCHRCHRPPKLPLLLQLLLPRRGGSSWRVLAASWAQLWLTWRQQAAAADQQAVCMAEHHCCQVPPLALLVLHEAHKQVGPSQSWLGRGSSACAWLQGPCLCPCPCCCGCHAALLLLPGGSAEPCLLHADGVQAVQAVGGVHPGSKQLRPAAAAGSREQGQGGGA